MESTISDSVPTSSTNSIGDVQLVSSPSAVVENNDEENKEEEQMQETNALVSNETISTSSTVLSFVELKNERDLMYSRSLETYQKIIDNESLSSEQKSIAIQEIDKISQMQNSLHITEELIKLKGFEDVVIYFSNEKASVVVRATTLSDAQVAQIQNIVVTQLGVKISDITISNK